MESIQKEGLNARLARIEKALGTNKKEGKTKIFKLPWQMNMKLKAKAKKGWILVFFLRSNRNLDMFFKQVNEERVIINECPYSIPTDSIFIWKGKFPAVILPEWMPEPLSIENIYDKDRTYAYVQKNIIRLIKSDHSQLTEPKAGGNMTPLIWIVILIAAVYLGYTIFLKPKGV